MASSFGFAFDNPRFSDRIMSIEIIPNPAEADDGDTDLPTENCEPSRGEDTSMHGEEHTGNYSMSDVEDSTASDNEEEDGNAIIVEKIISYLLRFKKSGDEATRKRVADGNTDSSTVLRVKTIHISSAILAKKSPFFYQLFSDETREPGQRVTTLRIHDYEEASLMELLNFMYNDTLSTTTPSSLLDILMAADDFEVASCMRYCSQQLSKLPMNCESALAYLSLPSCVSHADALQQLTDSAKQFLAVKFRDIYQFYNEILDLPLAGIEAVLSSDDIQLLHEDDVYDIVLKWAHLNYPQLKERQEILETRLCHLIRFPYMTNSKLQEATTDANISPGVVSKFILEALFFKNIGRPCIQRQLALGSRQDAGENSTVNRQFVQRSYLIQPVRVVEFELPRPHCVAYLNLRREECARLFPDWWNLSEGFLIGAQSFFLMAQCTMDVESLSECFSLNIGLKEPGSANVSIDFEFAARSKEDQDEYKRLYKNSYTLTPQGAMVGCRNLFKTPWATFIADDSPLFINGILYLRAVITIK